jgi:hypothetical protein
MGENYGKRFSVNTLGEELPMKWKSVTTVPVSSTSRVAGRSLRRITTPIKVFLTFHFHIGTSKFDVRIYDGTQCKKEYEAEVHFH